MEVTQISAPLVWKEANVERILVGKVLSSKTLLRSFLRARVILDSQKPLAHGFWIPKPDGCHVWISIRYEKLQSFCYTYGKDLGQDRFKKVEEECGGEEEQADVNAFRCETRQSNDEASIRSTKAVMESPDRQAGFSLKDQNESSLAVVLYSGQVMNDVICGISGLGIKRSADEELVLPVSKRRKKSQVEAGPKFVVSEYADNLRKTKARIKRSAKKKGRDVKAQGDIGGMVQDAVMEGSEEPTLMVLGLSLELAEVCVIRI
ncbi:hypothetical protein K1719_015135 [Acacia pycnantha]|nr:hypothetical protein K1719_015135 [Acacia pycnantha]